MIRGRQPREARPYDDDFLKHEPPRASSLTTTRATIALLLPVVEPRGITRDEPPHCRYNEDTAVGGNDRQKTLARREWVIARWLVLAVVLGGACGSGSAFFLYLLERATRFRETHETIVWFLPLAGFVMGLAMTTWGHSITSGNNLVLDAMHDGGPSVPFRMAPMVVLGTVMTHLFGGSAGREGTAVQMGGSFADALARRMGATPDLRRQLIAAGVAGGFGSIFGTPVAGAVFGLEVLIVGRIEYAALFPALIASIVGDATTRGLGIRHSSYPTLTFVPLTPILLVKWLVFAAIVALVSATFIELLHLIKKHGEKRLTWPPLRMACGGAAVIAMWKMVGTSDYPRSRSTGDFARFPRPNPPLQRIRLQATVYRRDVGGRFYGGGGHTVIFSSAPPSATCSQKRSAFQSSSVLQ